MTERCLSRRESEILSLVAEGETTKAIASRLRISHNTVNWHIGNAFAKLGASSRAEAVAVALRDGELDPAAGSRPPDPVSPRPSWRPVALRVALGALVALALAAQVTVASGTRVDVEVRREGPSPRIAGTAAPSPASPASTGQPTASAAPTDRSVAPPPLTGTPVLGAVAPATPPPTAAPAATQRPAIRLPLPLPAVSPALPSLP